MDGGDWARSSDPPIPADRLACVMGGFATLRDTRLGVNQAGKQPTFKGENSRHLRSLQDLPFLTCNACVSDFILEKTMTCPIIVMERWRVPAWLMRTCPNRCM